MSTDPRPTLPPTTAAAPGPSPVHPTGVRAGLPILILAVAAFVIVTTEYLILGLLPALARDLGISIALAGQLVTLFAFTVMLAGPPLTAWLGYMDRKRLFIGILLLFVAANALAAVAPNLWVLALARFIPALALPVFWGTASDTASQLAGPGKSGSAVSQVYLGISAALVLGIPLGTLAADAIGWRGAFWILSALSLAMAALLYAYMPRLPLPVRDRETKQGALFRDRNFLLNVGLSVILFTAMFTAYTYLADTLERVAHIAPSQVGWWLMGFGVVGLFGNWAGGRIVDRSPLGGTLLFVTLLALAMLAMVPAAGSLIGVAVVLVVWGVSYTALFPICQVRVMNAGRYAPALAGTMNVSAANAGTGFGAMLGGYGIAHWGLPSVGYLGAGMAAAAILLALWMLRRAHRSVPLARPAVA